MVEATGGGAHRAATVGPVASGVRGMRLLGQTVEAYGKDLPGRSDVYDLASGIEGSGGSATSPHTRGTRPSGSSAHRYCRRSCESFSLPVRSGDSDVLIAMPRGYQLDVFIVTPTAAGRPPATPASAS